MASVAAARFKLVFFVPPSSLPTCKAAIFAAGPGHYPGPRNYTECCFASMVPVSFALETQRPHIPETKGGVISVGLWDFVAGRETSTKLALIFSLIHQETNGSDWLLF